MRNGMLFPSPPFPQLCSGLCLGKTERLCCGQELVVSGAAGGNKAVEIGGGAVCAKRYVPESCAMESAPIQGTGVADVMMLQN